MYHWNVPTHRASGGHNRRRQQVRRDQVARAAAPEPCPQPFSCKRPATGMTVAFKAAYSESLAGIPATITCILGHFPSGDYLVTLEYAQPVKFRAYFIRHIEAFASELDVVSASKRRS